MTKPKCTQSYLEGEFNAVQACGTAITEAASAIKGQIKNDQSMRFALEEFMGIMLRATMLIKEQNKALGIEEGGGS